jgi:hypothetical protein
VGLGEGEKQREMGKGLVDVESEKTKIGREIVFSRQALLSSQFRTRWGSPSLSFSVGQLLYRPFSLV